MTGQQPRTESCWRISKHPHRNDFVSGPDTKLVEVVPRSVADSLAEALERDWGTISEKLPHGAWMRLNESLAEYRVAYPREETTP